MARGRRWRPTPERNDIMLRCLRYYCDELILERDRIDRKIEELEIGLAVLTIAEDIARTHPELATDRERLLDNARTVVLMKRESRDG